MAAGRHLGKFLMAVSPQTVHSIHFTLTFYDRIFSVPILYIVHHAVIFFDSTAFLYHMLMEGCK